jgi:hypothetical protein
VSSCVDREQCQQVSVEIALPPPHVSLAHWRYGHVAAVGAPGRSRIGQALTVRHWSSSMDTTSAKPQAAGRHLPGNPYNRRLGELRRTLLNFATQDDMEHVARELKELAMGGGVAAIQLLFEYVLGKPKQTVEPDLFDLEDEPKREEPVKVILQPPIQTVEAVTEATWPCEMKRPFLPKWRTSDAREAGRRHQTVEMPRSPMRIIGALPKGERIANGVNGSGP